MAGRGSRSIAAGLLAIGLALVMIAIAPAAVAAREAVISAVSTERRGETLELHFRLTGTPQILMTGRGNDLRSISATPGSPSRRVRCSGLRALRFPRYERSKSLTATPN